VRRSLEGNNSVLYGEIYEEEGGCCVWLEKKGKERKEEKKKTTYPEFSEEHGNGAASSSEKAWKLLQRRKKQAGATGLSAAQLHNSEVGAVAGACSKSFLILFLSLAEAELELKGDLVWALA